ncbi:MAG: DRTGG domain-containing protein [Oscillospiraceae bacterium]|nr:DRTGG domain-containing protein [Oscillospiraceae bacterium]
MKLSDVKTILDAKIFCHDDLLDEEVNSACGSDLMSDVLAFVKNQSILLTGLNNQQVVRTAEMMDMSCIVFVRGKAPEASVINLAEARGLALMATELTMYQACGKLYAAGLGDT